jgi:hypothetical protein
MQHHQQTTSWELPKLYMTNVVKELSTRTAPVAERSFKIALLDVEDAEKQDIIPVPTEKGAFTGIATAAWKSSKQQDLMTYQKTLSCNVA